ncbi:unnamed protein product [Rotaria magnacalcarata]|uniref:Innexin n=2 Tax=Rotaria magnacalcarata TaxID=392030 RepID=A0A816YR27_9BILA|nr:unnamed protein product [Rotaria magnacalcarata]CAF2165789.1 unnamed protein product [Rotaria magnacalcarata]
MVDIIYIITLVPTILLSSLRSDDDAFDKINYKYTVALLVLFATITATKQFEDDRIECWNRANFIKSYIAYTNQICYISSTYYVNRNKTISDNIQDRMDRRLNYYQWTPFIILLMALFFYIPRLLWRALSVRSGIDLLDLVEAADDIRTVKEFDGHNLIVKHIVDTIDMYVDDARRQVDAEKRQTPLFKKLFQLICCMTGKFLGNYFITLYIFAKLYYIFNVIWQICLLNIFLGTNFLQFGFESVRLFRYGLNQPESKYFPRETFCDFYVREPLRGGEPLQRITVQCVLTVNLFNQQIFTLLWIWFVTLFFLNIYSLCAWIGRLAIYKNRYNFIRSRLTRTSRNEIARFRFDFKHSTREQGDFVHEALIRAFIMEYLEQDGYFFIRMLTANVSDFIVQEIIEKLWDSYVMRYGEKDAINAELSYSSNRSEEPTSTITSTNYRMQRVAGELRDASDSKRKYSKQLSEVGPFLSEPLTADDAISSSNQQKTQQV